MDLKSTELKKDSLDRKGLVPNLTFCSLEGAKAKSEMLSDRKPSFVVLCLIPVLVDVMTDEKITRG